MAENTTIRDSFFDSLAKGAKWDVGVSINRTNPLPLDQYSVFKTETELDTYIAGAFSYPGQIVALVGEAETVIYYLAEKVDHSGLEKIEVGSMPGVDNNSIEIKIDENGDEYLTLVGLEDAKVGASLVKGADGKISWSATTQSDLDADLTDIKSNINKLDVTVFGVESDDTDKPTLETLEEKYLNNGLINRVDNLEDKFDSMGAIFNYRGAITVGDNETIGTVIDFIPVAGDVVLVNGKQEYVYAEGKWEPFGDPHGVETLANTVAGHTSNITDLQGRMTDAENTIGLPKIPANPDEGEAGRDASGLYAYVDEVATEKANAAQAAAEQTAASALSPVATKANDNAAAIVTINTNLALKANASEVESKFTEVNNEIAKKADATETTNALNEKATKTELTNGLAGKADKTTTETAISGLDTRLTTAESDIDKLEAAVGTDGLAGKVAALEKTDENHQTAINGLTSNLGTLAGAETGTAFGEIAATKALATAAQTQADKGVADAAKAQGAAEAADGKAQAAQKKADDAYALAEIKVNTDTYTGKVAEIEGKIQANATAIDTKAETTYVNEQLATKVNNNDYTTKVGQLEEAIGLKAEKSYVDGELAKKADKTATENAISEINAKIGTLGNVMNFIGKLTTDENGNITTKGEHGDVGYVDDFEYVYVVTGEGDEAVGKWEKFGDTSAESGRISALETVVGNLDNSGLIKDVADLKAEDVSIKAAADALSTSVDNRFKTVNETLTSLDTNKVDVSVYNEKIAALEAADTKEAKDRDDAVKAEASARAAAISALDTYYQDALSWGTF